MWKALKICVDNLDMFATENTKWDHLILFFSNLEYQIDVNTKCKDWKVTDWLACYCFFASN